MGEKIRDIKSIHIGKSSFMVELNEGYSASQGHLIHIQNKKFRYLLTENDFYHLGAMIMRAWSEFSYLKHKEPILKEVKDFASVEMKKDLSVIMKNVATLFKREKIEYRLLDIQSSLLSVIVKEEDLKHAEMILSSAGAKKIPHPMGKDLGYQFLYQMHPFVMYEFEGGNVEVFCQLPCRSITAKTWIPLDRMIQSRLWTMKKNDGEIIWCDDLSRYIYLLCWAIFVDQGFSPHIRTELSSTVAVLSIEGVEEIFSSVFFNYSFVIIDKLKKNDFDSIISDYYGFINY